MSSVTERKDPYVDVYHLNNEVIVVIDLPGMDNIQNIELKIEGDQLTITGRLNTPYQGFSAILQERRRGEFQKIIPLGVAVEKRYNSARYRKGVLEIRFSKVVPTQHEKKKKT
nr:Hsp20/alpha crystallin family protein [Polycladospora coralii]